MNRDDIIRMAREAGFNKTGRTPAYYAMPEEIERFFQAAHDAAAAAEREACVKECDELAGMLFCHGDKSGAEIAVSLRDTIRARGQA